MPKYEVTSPDGRKVELTGDAPPNQQQLDEIFASLPPRKEAPSAFDEYVKRPAGLAARAGAEGVIALPAMMANAVAAGVNSAMGALGIDYQFPDQAQAFSQGLTRMGLPEAETATERMVQDIGQGVTAAATGIGAGRALASAGNTVAGNVGRVLAETPAMQGAAATTAAGAASATREMGGGPGAQAAAGLAGAIAAPAAVGAVRAGRAAVGAAQGVREAATEQGQRRVVGSVLADRARDPQRAASNLDDFAARQADDVTGTVTEQATGAASQDTGLLVLERAMRNKDTSGRFGAQMSDANLQRQKVLDVLGGSRSMDEMKAARDAATAGTREGALSAADGLSTDMKPVMNVIDGLLAGPSGARKEVKRALSYYRKQLEGETDARRLYEIRKDIGLDIGGKSRNPKRSDFQQAAKQLIAVQKTLDRQIEQVAPGFKKYLEDYAALSREIDQTQTIRGIQEKATLAVSDPSTRRDILSQAKFSRMVAKEREAGLLTDDQLNVLEAIAEDLDVGQSINAAGIRPSGSDTVQNLTVAHIIGRGIGGNPESPALQALVKPIKWVTEFTEDQIQGLLIDAMLDPKLAARLMRDATPKNVQAASNALSRLGAVSAVSGSEASAAVADG